MSEASYGLAMPDFRANAAYLWLLLGVALIASSCKPGGGESGEVSWPELNRLDEIAYRAEGLTRVGDFGLVRESLPELLEAGRALTPATIPSNAVDLQQVEAIVADLNSLMDGLSSEGLNNESLSILVSGLHPVISKLIDAAGMPHVHSNEGPNDGFLHPVFDGGGTQIGTAEIKLHDDAGDLEVWLTRGGHGGEPWRLPLDTTLALNFPDRDQTVTLAVRDRERNEDESGASTIDGGETAYFVFPGESGADASWLVGEDFAAKAELRFEDATTGSLILRPHIHPENGD
ncbi:MAG: hypothetical protein AAGA96_08125 [Verrucomicrobiota bacterium]